MNQKNKRIDLLISQKDKKIIQLASEISDVSISQFIRRYSLEAAKSLLQKTTYQKLGGSLELPRTDKLYDDNQRTSNLRLI
jgi:uncharacterized protein (DUF1778 family)